MEEEQPVRKTVRELPYLIRVDKETHTKLKRLKRTLKKSMAQIVIDLVSNLYEERK